MTAGTGATAERTVRFLSDNLAHVLASGEETGGAYSLLEMVTAPGGGGNVLHADTFPETCHVLEGRVEWTVEREGRPVTWVAGPGETVVVPEGVPHRFVGAGSTPSRMLVVGTPKIEALYRALAEAWPGPYDRTQTPQAVAPVFARFGVRFVKP